MNSPIQPSDLNRRDFLRGSSFASLMMFMGGVPILSGQDQPTAADGATKYSAKGSPLNLALIGCGPWGREILKAASRLPMAPVVAISDTYARALKRAKDLAPQTETFTDYNQLLAKKDVEGVIVATPTPTHKEIVLAALKAGKHVYCEMPLAPSVEDTKAIAEAAQAYPKLNFQCGLQYRSDPQLKYLSTFVRSGVLGKNVRARGQWHKKQSWRTTAADPDREKAVNWRLDAIGSAGLLGEVGVHQLDLAMWYFNSRPKAVASAGGIVLWDDGRDVPDNVEAIFEFPGGVLFSQACSLASSFDASYDLFQGEFNTIMVRDRRAWMFKEADAPQLGWEVYAKRDTFFKESGIVLGANSTKLAAQGEKASQDATMVDDKGQMFYAIESFVTNSHLTQTAVADYSENFDANDSAALRSYLEEGLAKSRLPFAGFKEGYEATVASLKANESVVTKKRVAIEKALYTI